MSTQTPAAAGGNPRRGLRGSLDLRLDVIDDASRLEVTGWVFHAHAEVLLEAHKLRVARNDYAIAEIHLADAIEALTARRRESLSADRGPKNPYVQS